MYVGMYCFLCQQPRIGECTLTCIILYGYPGIGKCTLVYMVFYGWSGFGKITFAYLVFYGCPGISKCPLIIHCLLWTIRYGKTHIGIMVCIVPMIFCHGVAIVCNCYYFHLMVYFGQCTLICTVSVTGCYWQKHVAMHILKNFAWTGQQ